MQNFSQQVLRTREQGMVLQLCLVKMPPLLGTPFLTNLHVRTNASAGLNIPVSVFSGKVVPIWSHEQDDQVDDLEYRENNATNRFIGWLTEGSSKEIYLALWNPNPVGVSLQGWGTNSSNALLTYMGSEIGTPTQFKSRFNHGNLTMATTIRPGSYAVFQLHILMKESENEEISSTISVHVRTVLETVTLTLRYRTVPGTLMTIPAPLPWRANFLDPYLTTEVYLFNIFYILFTI